MADPTSPPSPTPASASPKNHAIQMGVVVLTFCLALNGAFYFLSDLYFEDRATRYGIQELANISGVRGAFAIFTSLVGLASLIAALAPRWVGHGIAGAASIASLFGAYGAWSHDMPAVLTVALVLLGGLFPALVWRSLLGSRAAWSFLISLTSVYALVLLFGAPKVRTLLEIGLWTALIVPGFLAVGAISLVMLHHDYRDR